MLGLMVFPGTPRLTSSCLYILMIRVCSTNLRWAKTSYRRLWRRQCRPNRHWVWPMFLGPLIGVLAGDLMFMAPVSQAVARAPVAAVTVESQPGAFSLAQERPSRLARITRPTLQLGSTGETVQELQAVLRLLGYYSGSIDGQYLEATEAAVRKFQTAAGLTPDGVVGSATWNQLFPSPPQQANPPSTSTSTSEVSGPISATATPPPETDSPTATSADPSPSSDSDPPQISSESRESESDASEPSAQAPVELPVLRPGLVGPAVARLQERLKVLGVYTGAIDGIFGRQTEAAVRQIQRRYRLQVDGIVGPSTWQALLAN